MKRVPPTIGIFGSHTAEQWGTAAKAMGFETAIVVEDGRNELYTVHSRHLFDHIITVSSFPEILRPDIQQDLIDLNVLFTLSRSFPFYVGAKKIEDEFVLPLLGNRWLQAAEDELNPRGQHYLNRLGGLDIPMKFEDPEKIDRLVIVKVRQSGNVGERAFFYASSPEEYYRQAKEKIEAGEITKTDIEAARIEEYIFGARFNANFYFYSLTDQFGEYDLTGFTDRRQVNLQGYLNLTARDQLGIKIPVRNEEIGHYGITMRESKKMLAYNAAKKLMNICKQIYPLFPAENQSR